MKETFLTIAVLFLIGGIGIFFINKKLCRDRRLENWKKYLFYLLIISTVLASVILDNRMFAGLFMLVNTIGLLEMMTVSQNADKPVVRKKFLYTSFLIFGIIFLFFSIFSLLPREIIIFTYTVVLIFDGACQVSGQLLGRNKIAPVISPNKTWEGFIYGTLMTLITAVLIRNPVGFSPGKAVLTGLIICLSSFAGDLMASAFKRKFGAKNYSNLLPGQGGMFDRFDSFLVSGAIVGIIGIPLLYNNGFDKDVLLYGMITLLFFGVLLTGEFLYLTFSIKPEYTRLISHFLAGLTALLFLTRFSVHWYVLALCIHFALFLYVTARKGFLISHHQVKRETHGSTIFFAGIFLTYYASVVFSRDSLFVIPILILTVSDPLAALAGINIRSGHWVHVISGVKSPKTFIGSGVFLVTCVILLLLSLPHFYTLDFLSLIMVSLVLGILSGLTETLSSNGTDNITVPVVLITLLMALEYFI